MPADRLSPPVDFTNPPVNESVISVQFVPIPKFGLPHVGLYWARIRANFPKFETQPALPPITERFDAPSRPLRFGIQLMSQPDFRCWFLSESGTSLLQLQPDRFIHNWRQITGEEAYPRYPNVRETFEKYWNDFCDFLRLENLEQPQVNQLEVTYVNHIEYKKGWKDYGDFQDVIAFWSGRGTDGFLPAPERVNMEAVYRLPNNLGRLYVTAAPVIRGRDSQEVLQLTLTARGAPTSSGPQGILEWMDLGRTWIVKGFSDFTARNMHQLWGRKK